MAFAQVATHRNQEAPSEAPETWEGTYQKKGEEHGGVVEMIDMLVADLDKDTQEKTVEEEDAQAEYETFTADSQAKRAADSKSVAEKEGAKADLESNIQKMKLEKKATSKEAMAKAKYIYELHSSCDWLLSNFEARKTARAGEVKAVLSGADFECLQTRSEV